MLETLARPLELNASAAQQEIYELRIDQWDEIRGRGYFVRTSLASWSEIDRRVMWTEESVVSRRSYKEARQFYEHKRAEIVSRGFTFSDLEW